jgi:hypothetical protein
LSAIKSILSRNNLFFNRVFSLYLLLAHNCWDAQGFQENKEAAQAGGKIAGNARKELETKSGRRVVSSSNFFSHQLDVKEKGLKEIEIEDTK